jgi:hypothetical protein
MEGSSLQILDHYLIVGGASFSQFVTTPAFKIGGNYDVVTVVTHDLNLAASLQFDIALEGSYDGKNWQPIATGTISALPANKLTILDPGSQITHPLLRFSMILTGTVASSATDYGEFSAFVGRTTQ